jgi:hypothetical protein
MPVHCDVTFCAADIVTEAPFTDTEPEENEEFGTMVGAARIVVGKT